MYSKVLLPQSHFLNDRERVKIVNASKQIKTNKKASLKKSKLKNRTSPYAA